jgi:hypothetical protein
VPPKASFHHEKKGVIKPALAINPALKKQPHTAVEAEFYEKIIFLKKTGVFTQPSRAMGRYRE